jgi:hypothetical protein
VPKCKRRAERRSTSTAAPLTPVSSRRAEHDCRSGGEGLAE